MEARDEDSRELLREVEIELRQVLDAHAWDTVTLTGHLPDGFELIRSQGVIPRKDYLSLAVVAIPISGKRSTKARLVDVRSRRGPRDARSSGKESAVTIMRWMEYTHALVLTLLRCIHRRRDHVWNPMVVV